MKKILLAALTFFSLSLSAYAAKQKAFTLPHSVRIYDPVCWEEFQSGSMMLTITKHPVDNDPLKNFTFYLQHSDSVGFTEYTPYYYPVSDKSSATFNFFPLPPGSYMLFASYYFYDGFFRQEGEAWIEFTINSVTKMEVPYIKKDIAGMQFFDGEWEKGKNGFIVFNFDSIKNGIPPYQIIYKDLYIENSSDTIFFDSPTPTVFTVWDDDGCYMDIYDSIIILPDTLRIGISLDKPLLSADVSDAHLSIVQYNKPEVLLIDWYKNDVLIKSGLEDFLYDVDTGEYYAIGYGQRTGLVSSSRITVKVDTFIAPSDTVVIPQDTIIIPQDTVTAPSDTAVIPQDTIIIPQDTVTVPSDTVVIPQDTVTVPSDTVATPPYDTLLPCDSSIAADFWICSEFILYDVGLAVNVSRTPFDSMLWTFPPSAELRYEDYEELELQFNDTGTFNIGMLGYYYDCIAKKESPITVSLPPQKNPERRSASSIIRRAEVYPQPVTSESVFEIETEIDAYVDIKIYSAATGIQYLYDSFSTRANERIYLPVGTEKFSSGSYILLITATAPNKNISVKTIKIIAL